VIFSEQTGYDLAFVAAMSALVVLLIGIAELVRKSYPAFQEGTRKLVHMATGLLIAGTPYVIGSKWPLVVVALFFVIFNAIALSRGWLSGLHDTLRPTLGTVFYPISFLILLLWLWEDYRVVLICSMLIMAIADALAALVGGRAVRPRVYYLGPEAKSIQGSAAMFVTSFLIVLACLWLLGPKAGTAISVWWMALAVAIVATVCEAISFNGSDNLTVPLGSAFILHYLLSRTPQDAVLLIVGLLLSLALALVSYRIGFLNASGAAASFLLGTIVFGVGRWTFALPILTFFILSSLLSQLGKRKKKLYAGIIEKGGRRDAMQVIANGGVAGLLLLIWYFHPMPVFYLLYAASLAAVTADTWATELGLLSTTAPRSILTFKPVPAGTSGGLSLIGTAGAALGSMVLAAVSVMIAPLSFLTASGGLEFILISSAGFVASLVDSLLGATWQARYICPSCGKATEKRVHCRQQITRQVGGLSWMNNDVVNVLAAFSGMALAGLTRLVFKFCGH